MTELSGKKYYRLPDHENNAAMVDSPRGKSVVKAVTNTPPSLTDPLGMYTGRPENKNDTPVQDVDDL